MLSSTTCDIHKQYKKDFAESGFKISKPFGRYIHRQFQGLQERAGLIPSPKAEECTLNSSSKLY